MTHLRTPDRLDFWKTIELLCVAFVPSDPAAVTTDSFVSKRKFVEQMAVVMV